MQALLLQRLVRQAIHTAGHGNQGAGDHGIGVVNRVIRGIQHEAVDADAEKQTAHILAALPEPVSEPYDQKTPKPDPVSHKAHVQVHPQEIIVDLHDRPPGCLINGAGLPVYIALKSGSPAHEGKIDIVVGFQIREHAQTPFRVNIEGCLQVFEKTQADSRNVQKADQHHPHSQTQRRLPGRFFRQQAQKERKQKSKQDCRNGNTLQAEDKQESHDQQPEQGVSVFLPVQKQIKYKGPEGESQVIDLQLHHKRAALYGKGKDERAEFLQKRPRPSLHDDRQDKQKIRGAHRAETVPDPFLTEQVQSRHRYKDRKQLGYDHADAVKDGDAIRSGRHPYDCGKEKGDQTGQDLNQGMTNQKKDTIQPYRGDEIQQRKKQNRKCTGIFQAEINASHFKICILQKKHCGCQYTIDD